MLRAARLLTGVLILAAIGLLVWWLVLGRSASRDAALDRSAASALATARQVAVNANSFDYQHIDAQFGQVARDLTGQALSGLTSEKGAIKKQLTSLQASSQAEVITTATVDASSDEATEIVALQITYRTADGKTTASRSYARMHLVRSGGRWLVDQFSGIA